MTIEKNLINLKKFMHTNGWVLKEEDSAFEYYYNHMNFKLSFPKLKNDVDYPRMLALLFKKIEKFNPDISQRPFFAIVKSQCKNLKQKYSKDKEDWILLEPNCKYRYSEIPEIYVPNFLSLKNLK